MFKFSPERSLKSGKLKNNRLAADYGKKGNEFYLAKKFNSAIIQYNKSLCEAEETLETALAYGNRSAVYLETKQYKQCLENIEMAKESGGYPITKIPVFIRREQKCRDMMLTDQNPYDLPADFIKLSYPANPKLPFIVNSIGYRYNQEFGSHLITTTDMKAGDIIIIEEPTCTVLSPSQTFVRCLNKLNLIPYLTCNRLMFCSVKCRDDGVENFHQFICGINECYDPQHLLRFFFESLRAYGSVSSLKEMLLNPKLNTNTIFDFDLSDENDPERSIWFINNTLVRTYDKMYSDEELRFFRQVYAPDIRRMLDTEPWKTLYVTPDEKKDVSFVLEKLAKLRGPPVEYKYQMTSHIGYRSLWPVGMLINHSCFPNVRFHRFDNKNVYSVTVPIKANDQLFVCYGIEGWNMPKIDRQKTLLRDYGFHCKCIACRQNYPLVTDAMCLTPNWRTPTTINFKGTADAIEELKTNIGLIINFFPNINTMPSRELYAIIHRNSTIMDFLLNFTEVYYKPERSQSGKPSNADTCTAP